MDFDLTAEQRLIVETVSDFVRGELYPHEAEVERLDEVPAEVAAAIREKAISAGLYAANMPAELGGGGLDAVSMVLVERELGRASYALPSPRPALGAPGGYWKRRPNGRRTGGSSAGPSARSRAWGSGSPTWPPSSRPRSCSPCVPRRSWTRAG